MGGILNLIFSKKIETYMPFYFLGVSFNKCEADGEKHRAGTSGRTVLI